MCGIFGCVTEKGSEFARSSLQSTVNELFRLSESRGKESAGLAVYSGRRISVYKQPVAASAMIKSPGYRAFLKEALKEAGDTPAAQENRTVAVIGHSRLVTNGFQTIHYNNQPVVKNSSACVHNGIVVNDSRLWREFPDLEQEFEVDTEIILALLMQYYSETSSTIEAARRTFERIEGAASIAAFVEGSPGLLVATNTGSLYYLNDPDNGCFIFASEKYILRKLIPAAALSPGDNFESPGITQLKAHSCLEIDLFTGEQQPPALLKEGTTAVEAKPPPRPEYQAALCDVTARYDPAKAGLKRCTRCILPETMPFISFDPSGVCNYCRNYRKLKHLGEDALMEYVERYRLKSPDADCIVSFSGGRDSSYCLHYVKTVLKMNPIAYTYDWGMVTDLARRNQSRLCGRLGVEHIIVSGDIRKKRNNICRNINAWLKRPTLGMIPLFMAGDKQLFYYANKLRKQTGIDLIIFSMNFLEKTNFKTGFCNVEEGFDQNRHYALDPAGTLKLVSYYARELLLNPAYLNRSIFDSLFAFASYYLIPHNYLHFYKFIEWDEKTINDTLIHEYNWETAEDTTTTWRIGDGTAAFYNYIYYTVAGFTENDTLRSNQIREGKISREEALRAVAQENRPRYQSLREYAGIVGFDCDEAIRIINSMPRLYKI